MSTENTNATPAAEGDPAPAPAPAPDAYVDENGQPCSKNDYKKRMKAEANAPKSDAHFSLMAFGWGWGWELSLGLDMTSEDALDKLDEALAGQAFLKGTAPTKDDAVLLEKVLKADEAAIASRSNVVAWTKLLATFTPEMRSTWK